MLNGSIVANGGFTKSSQWVQLLANITGRSIIVRDNEDASSIGAAMLGYLSIGRVNRLEDFEQKLEAGRIENVELPAGINKPGNVELPAGINKPGNVELPAGIKKPGNVEQHEGISSLFRPDINSVNLYKKLSVIYSGLYKQLAGSSHELYSLQHSLKK